MSSIDSLFVCLSLSLTLSLSFSLLLPPSLLPLLFLSLLQVKVLYVRNLMLSTTEGRILEVFSAHAPVERVKKIRDYAFVHFHSRMGALKAMESLNGL